jgi:hypothetical protein
MLDGLTGSGGVVDRTKEAELGAWLDIPSPMGGVDLAIASAFNALAPTAVAIAAKGVMAGTACRGGPWDRSRHRRNASTTECSLSSDGTFAIVWGSKTRLTALFTMRSAVAISMALLLSWKLFLKTETKVSMTSWLGRCIGG